MKILVCAYRARHCCCFHETVTEWVYPKLEKDPKGFKSNHEILQVPHQVGPILTCTV